MARDRGKFSKPQRGGGKHFSRGLTRLDAEGGGGEKAGMWNDGPPLSGSEEEDSDEGSSEGSEEESEEEESEEEVPTTKMAAASLTPAAIEAARAERKAAKSALKPVPKKTAAGSDEEEEEEDEEENPNRTAGKSVKLADLGKATETPMSRREKESAQKKAAEEAYWKLHQAGKTDQAKSDLARLAQIRKDREQAAATRKAEADAKAKEVATKAAAKAKK